MIDKLLLEKYAALLALFVGCFLVGKEVYLFGPEVFVTIATRVLIALWLVMHFTPRLIDWLIGDVA